VGGDGAHDSQPGASAATGRSDTPVSNDGASYSRGGARPLFKSDLLSGIVASTADIALLLDSEGIIQSAMAGTDSRTMGEVSKWPGTSFRTLIDAASVGKLVERQARVVEAVEGGDSAAFSWAELTHRNAGGADFPVRYSVHWLRDRGLFLLLGRDQRQMLEIQQQLIGAQVALERDFEAQRKIDTRYRLLMDSTRDAFVLISMQNSRIVDLNSTAAAILGLARTDAIGASLAAEIEDMGAADLLAAIAAGAGGEVARAVNLRLSRGQRLVSLHPKIFRAAGERLALCRIEDNADAPANEGRLGTWLSELFHRGSDAIVFTDRDGVIDSASEAFLNLIDTDGLSAVRGRSLAEFLTRGAVDLKIILDNARRAGHVRSYSTRLTTDFDTHVAVEISATWLNDRPAPILALVLRDASLSLRLRAEGGDDSARSVMELVGSAPLKDIVAETANEVEKLCIETAIELTRNNRVAAAEMLGLSRQSLYVKLRKYGMLGRDEE